MLSIEFYGRIGSKKFITKGSTIGQFPSPSNINLNNAIFSTLLSSYFPTVRIDFKVLLTPKFFPVLLFLTEHVFLLFSKQYASCLFYSIYRDHTYNTPFFFFCFSKVPSLLYRINSSRSYQALKRGFLLTKFVVSTGARPFAQQPTTAKIIYF